MTSPTTQLRCACGQVQLEAKGNPIVSTECLCDSCRTAGARIEALPSVPPFRETTGGTRFVLYRKDRVRFVSEGGHLRELRLTPQSSTRRVVATCCNTPIFLEFMNGHWLSVYGCLWPAGTLPKLDLRTMTSDLPPGTALPDDAPNLPRQSGSFFVQLLGAWIAMGFRRPKITVVNGSLEA